MTMLTWQRADAFRSERAANIYACMLSFALVAVLGSGLHAQEPEARIACDEEQVDYTPADNGFSAGKILVQQLSQLPTHMGTKQLSPQRTRYLSLRSPDFEKPGPWNTTVFVGGAGLKGRELKISFLDHGSGGVHAEWLNEKLIFIEVWWGRIVATDLVLNVENASFIYKEDAQYGEMIQPCR